MAKFDFFQKSLIRYFKLHGGFVARHPMFVLSLSIIAAVAMCSGVVFIQFEGETEKIFTPTNSRASTEKEIMLELFPTDYENFYPSRITAINQRHIWLIVTPKEGSNVLTEKVVEEIMYLDEDIVSTSAAGLNGSEISYEIVCAQQRGSCISNPVLEWWKQGLESNLTSTFLPSEPLLLPSGSVLVWQSFLANGLVENGHVVSAEAISLYYYLRHEPLSANSQSGDWEDAVSEILDEMSFANIEVVYLQSDSLDESQSRLAISILPYFCATYGLLTMFAVSSCLMGDWVASKPWLANSGILSVFVATGSTVGLLSYCRVPMNQVVLSMPFLILGIGLDDMFIMISAWRQTNRFSSVEKRMSQALSEAAVSITVTTLTDFCAFCIGAISPLPGVRTFCLYTGVAVLLDFFFQITLFASIMVFTGRREAQNRHCYTCKKVLPKDNSPSTPYAIFCSGGVGKNFQEDESDHETDSRHACMTFFRDAYAPIITNAFMMGFVIVLYLLYVAASVYGCTQITEGLDLSNLAEKGSMTNKFYDTSSEYFPGSCPFVTVILNESLEYWEPIIQNHLDSLVSRFEENKYIESNEFWLDDFKLYVSPLNISHEHLSNVTVYSSLLQEGFLQEPAFNRYTLDLNFDEDGSVSSSRLILTTGSLFSTIDEGQMMEQLREIVDNASIPFHVEVFGPSFVAFEQYLIVTQNTIMNLSIALVAMLVISFLLIPSLPVACLVTCCVLSIELGVIGFMSLWGISLNGISMINIILCIGFSVDFSAHICYAVVAQNSKLVSAKVKVANALYSLGYPIVQSGMSTILSLLPLLFTKSYIFQSFAKIILLVMGLGVAHGLVVLPVLLTLIGKSTSTKPEQVKAEPDVPEQGEKGIVMVENAETTLPEEGSVNPALQFSSVEE